MTIGINNYPDPSGHSHAVDSNDVGIGLLSDGADPDSVRLGRNSSIADVDIVAASGEAGTGIDPQGDVVEASGIVEKRRAAHGGVAEANRILEQSLRTAPGGSLSEGAQTKIQSLFDGGIAQV